MTAQTGQIAAAAHKSPKPYQPHETPKRAAPARAERSALLDVIVGAILVLAVFGYPMVSTLPMFLSLDTRLVSVPFRAFVVALALAALALALLHRRRTQVPLHVGMLVAASGVILTLRFVNDSLAQALPVNATQPAGEFALFFFGVTLLPALALFVPLRNDIEDRLYKTLLAFGVATVGLATVATVFMNPDTDLAARADLEGLNAISYATMGAYLLLLLWSLPAPRHGARRPWFFSACGVLLGLVPLLTAASKGPIISLIIVLASFHVVSSGKGRRGLTSLIALTVVVVLAAAASLWAGATADADDAVAIAQRLSDVSGDRSTVERLVILNSSWDVFTANPLLGGAMVEPIFNAYPHNILLEALMVGGIPFGAITLLLVLVTTIKAVRLMDSPSNAPLRRFIGMLALFVLLMSMLSGSLYKSPDFWAVVALCFALRATRTGRRRTKHSIQGAAIGHAGRAATPTLN